MCVFCYVFVIKRKTAYEMRISDWSSDVCSSDRHGEGEQTEQQQPGRDADQQRWTERGVGERTQSVIEALRPIGFVVDGRADGEGTDRREHQPSGRTADH